VLLDLDSKIELINKEITINFVDPKNTHDVFNNYVKQENVKITLMKHFVLSEEDKMVMDLLTTYKNIIPLIFLGVFIISYIINKQYIFWKLLDFM
jgi:hypothetical protein